MPAIPTERVILGLPGRVVFALLVLFAIAVFVYSMSRRIRVLLAGRPDDRFRDIPRRVGKTLEYAFAQKRMFRDLYAGFFHILIFGGFVVLTVRSIALVLEGSIPGFVLLPGPPGDYYTFLKDVFEVLTLAGVLLAVLRRAFARPKRLDLSWDAWLILFLIGLLMATDLLAAGAQLALAPSLQTRWSPVVLGIARMLSGTSPARLQAIYETCWWVHLADLLFFGNYLPYSKHFHIITSIPNIFFMNLAPMGRLKTVDLENTERFGASRVEDLTWKSMLDGYTCTECGRCRVVCPTALTGKPLDPKIFIGDVRDAVYEATPGILEEYAAKGGRRPPAAQGPHRRMDLGGHDLGMHDVRLLHDRVPGLHRAGRRQDPRDAPLPGPRQGRVPQGGPERLPGDGDQREPMEHLGRLARRLGEGPLRARRDHG
jgi:ferredoxin